MLLRRCLEAVLLMSRGCPETVCRTTASADEESDMHCLDAVLLLS